MLIRTPVEGYIAACMPLAAANQTAAICRLRLPVLVIGGAEDGASPCSLAALTHQLNRVWS